MAKHMCSTWCLDRGRNLVRMWRDEIFQFWGYIIFYCIYEHMRADSYRLDLLLMMIFFFLIIQRGGLGNRKKGLGFENCTGWGLPSVTANCIIRSLCIYISLRPPTQTRGYLPEKLASKIPGLVFSRGRKTDGYIITTRWM